MTVMLWFPYVTLVLTLLAPTVVRVPVYLQMITISSSCLLLGSYRAGTKEQERKQSGGNREAQVITGNDAYKFPVIASLSLLGLFFAFKFLPEYWLNLFLTCYAVILGSSALFTFTLPLVSTVLKDAGPSLSLFHVQLNVARFICFGFACAVGLWYFFSKDWLANNILGASMAVLGIEVLALGDFLSSCILLCGLFFYDIFWVFGSKPVFGANVMVTVARNFEGPIKLVFPKTLSEDGWEFSMLGLGDIVIPGLFVAMILRFDWRTINSNATDNAKIPYFITVMTSYISGLSLTFGAVELFDAAQPALLYLVPCCLGSVIILALFRKEFKQLVTYNESAEQQPSKEYKST
eukprot:jgi/Galph1/834/GphlegSOOS_G5492.1